ncbi:hypothetical protein CsSME_00013801 [Camellia sinensis var. sinensis]
MAESNIANANSDYAEIVVVRHGETAWNAEGRVQGHLDVELNEVGRQQAAAVIQDPNLRERHLGDLQGFVFHKAAKLRPDAYLASLSARTDQEIPGGGESLDQLFNRCTSSLQSIGMKHTGERVVVVTHGGVIRALHKRAAPTEQLQRKILNASVNLFHLSKQEEWIIKTWGDVNHLNKTGFLEAELGGDSTSN